VSQGNRFGSWNISPRSALGPVIGSLPTNKLPDVGSSSPASMRSSVDLPQPLGPTSDTISPGAIDSVAPVSASTSLPSAAVKRFERSSMRRLEPSLPRASSFAVAAAVPVTI
jgi:hypothetical protein